MEAPQADRMTDKQTDEPLSICVFRFAVLSYL